MNPSSSPTARNLHSYPAVNKRLLSSFFKTEAGVGRWSGVQRASQLRQRRTCYSRGSELLPHRPITPAALRTAQDPTGRLHRRTRSRTSDHLNAPCLTRFGVSRTAGKFKVSDYIDVVDALPRNTSGKVDKLQLRQRG